MRIRFGFGQVLAATLVALAVVLGVVYLVVMHSFRVVIDEAGLRLRDAHAARIAEEVETYFSTATPTLDGAATSLQLDQCDPSSIEKVSTCLTSALLSNPNITEVTFTHGAISSWDEEGSPIVDRSEGVWQASAIRPAGEVGPLVRLVTPSTAHAAFVSTEREMSGQMSPHEMDVDDPSDHLTFRTPASKGVVGRTLSTDLSYSELDSHLPERERRIVVTLLRAVESGGRVIGVVRVGLLIAALDERVREASRENSPHQLFIADEQGRLVSRPDEGATTYEDEDTSLRVDPGPEHPELRAALALPGLDELSEDSPVLSGSVDVNGRTWLVSYRFVPGSQDWRIGVLVPLDHYLGEFEIVRRRLAIVIGLLLLGAAVFAAWTLHAMQGGFERIHRRIQAIIGFDFAPAPADATFHEMQETLDGLEQSKTALRAMSRYVPIDLVRQLLAGNRDPKLGGSPRVLTMMFTDIESFTSISESIPRDELAEILGRYFALMTEIVHRHEGTVDKYIGDALMVLWNAPTDVDDHASKGCEAVLEATRALAELFASDEWAGLPPLPTRFGLHLDEVLVGHFGAPDRISYTALGDGVNLASRLEGLNKQYGTRILVSETVAREAAATHEFRRVDRVAVKGRAAGIEVFELLGRKGECDERIPPARAYETALAAYFACRFDEAREAFASLTGDPAARTMSSRCEHFITDPPPADWTGVWVSRQK